MDLSTLNSRQKDAVTSTEGRIRVVAGAGSGKTKALAFRYAYIVNEIGIDPANILCLTFTNKVKLMTVHQSKGLEFPYVFIIGLSDGIFPNARSIRERKKNALEEERRLMYVATTRAQKCLFMTESEGYNMQAQQEKLPSRFIAEIKRDLFVTEGEMDEALWKRLQDQVQSEELGELTAPDEPTEDAERIKVGSMVTHKVFGKGEVAEIGENDSCKVVFEGGKVRFLRSTMLELLNTISIPLKTGPKNLS